MIHVDASAKKDHTSKKDHICILSSCSCKNERYLASIIEDLVITCDGIIDAKTKSSNEKAKTIPTNFNEKNITFKTQSFYILLVFFTCLCM